MVAIITGGTRGIGLGIAKELLKNDYSVILTARNEGSAVAGLKAQYGDKVHFLSCDISDENDINKLVSFAREKYGKIQLLVNNAGVAPKERKDILEITGEDFDYVTDINLKGTFFVTQKVTPLLIKNEKSRIVNISSMSSYTASINRGECNALRFDCENIVEM